MKEKWKVFIRGNKDRGEEVIKALEDCGASNSCGYIGDYDAALYFINHNGIIDSTRDYNAEFAKIIMDNYTELHLSEKWKDGDLLVDNDNPTKFIVKSNVWNGGWEDRFKAYLFVNPKSIQKSPIAIFCDAEYHKADSEEVRQFYELLHKYGKDWDAEKKQLVSWKWKPKENDSYYIIDNDGEITCDTWDGYHVDTNRYNFGNYFQTKEEAEAAAERVRKVLKGE